MSLVPQYQQSFVDELNAANTKATTLFASLALGSPRSQFAEMKPKYDEVVGALDGLRAQAASRPVGATTAKYLGRGRLKGLCQDAKQDANLCANATPMFLKSAIDILLNVEEVHQKSGVQRDLIDFYKPLYDEQMKFALTVENALRR